LIASLCLADPTNVAFLMVAVEGGWLLAAVSGKAGASTAVPSSTGGGGRRRFGAALLPLALRKQGAGSGGNGGGEGKRLGLGRGSRWRDRLFGRRRRS